MTARFMNENAARRGPEHNRLRPGLNRLSIQQVHRSLCGRGRMVAHVFDADITRLLPTRTLPGRLFLSGAAGRYVDAEHDIAASEQPQRLIIAANRAYLLRLRPLNSYICYQARHAMRGVLACQHEICP